MLSFGPIGFFIDFDSVNYTKTLDRVLGQIIREAAREWLRAVITSVPARGGFPVLTGEAKATLAPLGRFLRVAVPISPTFDGRHKFQDKRAEGEAQSQFKLESKNYNYSFEWSNEVAHYYINEFFALIPSAQPDGWHTLEAGERAMLIYVNDALERRLPNIAQYIGFSNGS